MGGDEPHAPASRLFAARAVARPFFSSYVAFLYGRLAPSRVADVDASVRWQLEHGRATTTPAEHASRPRVAHLTVTPAGPPISAIATALVAVDRGTESRLTATLEPRRGRWLVVAISG